LTKALAKTSLIGKENLQQVSVVCGTLSCPKQMVFVVNVQKWFGRILVMLPRIDLYAASEEYEFMHFDDLHL
jgi:hypothetical protein